MGSKEQLDMEKLLQGTQQILTLPWDELRMDDIGKSTIRMLLMECSVT